MKLSSTEFLFEIYNKGNEISSQWQLANIMAQSLTGSDKERTSQIMSKHKHWLDLVKKLTYHLFHVCEQHNLLVHTFNYNKVIQAWPSLMQRVS